MKMITTGHCFALDSSHPPNLGLKSPLGTSKTMQGMIRLAPGEDKTVTGHRLLLSWTSDILTWHGEDG